MTQFRPCIDLHAGQVKQIVGGTLTDQDADLQTNHVSQHSAEHFASLYRRDNLTGGHVICLGPGNTAAAEEALRAWPQGLQIGGGVNDATAHDWLAKGASKVIVTSFLFPDGRFDSTRLDRIFAAVGRDPARLVIDLSCRRKGSTWFVAMNKWQTSTEYEITADHVRDLEPFCSEFLIHAADNEGLQQGIDEELVQRLAQWCSIPVTYAGGAQSLEDLAKVDRLSAGKVDLTIGSALDIFGGDRVKYADCVAWNHRSK